MSWFKGKLKSLFGHTTKTSSNKAEIAPIRNSKLGSLGRIIFQVSDQRILTLSDYSREMKARYTTHEVIGSKPILEYLSPDLQSIKFKMQFSASLGVNPLSEIEKICEMCENGEISYLIIGNTVIGNNKWVIESVSESEDIWTPEGNLLYSEIEVNLREYI